MFRTMKRHVSYSKNGKFVKKQKLTKNAGGIFRIKANEKKHQKVINNLYIAYIFVLKLFC